MASGIVCNPDLTWIVFHGSYDFGYLLRLMSGQILPQNAEDFFAKLELYFKNIYDIKYITKEIEYLSGGLNRLASKLDVKRVGAKH